MKHPYSLLAVLAILLFAHVCFADVSGAQKAKMKMDALDIVVKPYLLEGEMATYDNFISRAGVEYAVISINFAPAFLAAITYDNGAYKVDFVRDNSTIRQIMESRLAAFNFSYQKVSPKDDLHPLFEKANATRFLPDAKCALLLGLPKEGCEGEEACAVACANSPVCAVYLGNGSITVHQVADYSAAVRELGALFATEAEISSAQISPDDELAVAGNYSEMIANIAENGANISANPVSSGATVCPRTDYDFSPLGDAKAKISTMMTSASLLEQKNSGILGLQTATAQRLPPEKETMEVSVEEIAKKNAQEEAAVKEDAQEGKGAAVQIPVKQAEEKPVLEGWTGDLARGVLLGLVVALGIGAGYFYYKKKKGQAGKGLRI